jgi:hypothetical protein
MVFTKFLTNHIYDRSQINVHAVIHPYLCDGRKKFVKSFLNTYPGIDVQIFYITDGDKTRFGHFALDIFWTGIKFLNLYYEPL